MKINFILNEADKSNLKDGYANLTIDGYNNINDAEANEIIVGNCILDKIEYAKCMDFIYNVVRKLCINGILTIVADDFTAICYELADELIPVNDGVSILYSKKYCYVSTALRDVIESYGLECIYHNINKHTYTLTFRRNPPNV